MFKLFGCYFWTPEKNKEKRKTIILPLSSVSVLFWDVEVSSIDATEYVRKYCETVNIVGFGVFMWFTRLKVYNYAGLILESFKFNRHKVMLLAVSYPDHSIGAKRHQLSIF